MLKAFMVPDIEAASRGPFAIDGIRPDSNKSWALDAKSRSLTRSFHSVAVKPTLISLNWTGPPSSLRPAAATLIQNSSLSKVAVPFTEKPIVGNRASEAGKRASPLTSNTVLAWPLEASVQNRRSLVPDMSAPKNSATEPISSEDIRPRSEPANLDRSSGLPIPAPATLTVNPPSPVANNCSRRLLPSRRKSRSTTRSKACSAPENSRTNDTCMFSSASRSISVAKTLGSMGTTMLLAALVNLAGIATLLARISASISCRCNSERHGLSVT